MTTVLQPTNLQDANETDIIIDVLRMFFDASSFGVGLAYIPQFTKTESLADVVVRLPDNLQYLSERITRMLHAVSLDDAGPSPPYAKSVGDIKLTFIALNQIYDINIGAIVVAGRQEIDHDRLTRIASFLESIVMMKKRARALAMIDQLSGMLEGESEQNIIGTLGSFVDDTVFPAETLIFQRKADQDDRFQVVYSTVHRDMIVPTESILGYAADKREIVIINDVSDKEMITAAYGRDIFNRGFLQANGFAAVIFVPVKMNAASVDLIFLCCFKRKNAVSIVEKEILAAIAVLIAHHFEVRSRQTVLEKTVAEAERLLEMSKQAMLVANIMHDASDDLVAARDNLLAISPRKGEEAALQTSKDVIGEILAAAAHFREVFGPIARQGPSSKIRPASVQKVQKVNLRDLVRKLQLKHKEEILTNNITFENSIPETWNVTGIYYLLRIAIDNLLKNSIYHLSTRTHIRRTIKVTVQRAEELEIISVHDNGPGIRQEDLEKVKKPFFSTRGGMGLGLAIAVAAAEAHGGELVVDSKPNQFFLAQLRVPVATR